MKVTVKVLNAFIENNSGGNPAGVVLDADNLSHNQKLSIASQVGLSETAFVSQSSIADFKLDFYTPNRQIAHCGHATIAVFSYLSQLKLIDQGWSSKETIDGNRKILIQKDMAYMEQLPPKYIEVNKYHQKILNSIGATQDLILRDPLLVNTGNSFIIVGVQNKQILAQLKLDFNAIKSISEELDLIGYYIYTNETHVSENDASTRMFFPRYGVDEEAATGMAAGPLASYLYDKINVKKYRFNIEQGYFMPVPSPSKIVIDLQIENNQISSLMAGGRANISKNIEIYI
jgi:PhzF family phenazine biosynthesis protein